MKIKRILRIKRVDGFGDKYDLKNVNRVDLKKLTSYLDSAGVSYSLSPNSIEFDMSELGRSAQVTAKKVLGIK